MRILHVEDDDTFRKWVKQGLKDFGFPNWAGNRITWPMSVRGAIRFQKCPWNKLGIPGQGERVSGGEAEQRSGLIPNTIPG